ncbi:hypothetical protein [Undibacterium pigrum]|uniref:Uncharacterized protein n=1 Tax=Undibacterium pigrum TaxID=401470 RepID=A0A318K103_9BURK|nr:hypothetical protein [Undibacterium pigrum]PXX46974.1 hypothetical protein DFR42_101550 [Undibacterium pigrum]
MATYTLLGQSRILQNAVRTTTMPYKLNYRENYSIPTVDAVPLVIENMEFIDRVEATSSKFTANGVWLDAVAERKFHTGDDEASRRAGADCQPDWNYKAQNDGRAAGEGEKLGNFNYGATGYLRVYDLLKLTGLPIEIASETARWIVRFGGGGYQLFSDAGKLYRNAEKGRWGLVWNTNFFSKQRTFYGEDQGDVANVESGINFGEFLRLSGIARQAGVRLDRENFGFNEPETSSWSGTLLEKPLDESGQFQQWSTRVLDDIERWRTEVSARNFQTEKAQIYERAQKLRRAEQQSEEEWTDTDDFPLNPVDTEGP